MSVHVGVDAQGNVGHLTLSLSQLGYDLHFGNGLNVEALNVGVQCQINFPIGLAYASVYNLLAIETMLKSAANLVATYAVDTQTSVADLLQQAAVGVGF